MRTSISFCLIFAVVINAAPHSKIRVKRAAEQLEFGNHQNQPRVKKADPSLPQKLLPPNPIATKRLQIDDGVETQVFKNDVNEIVDDDTKNKMIDTDLIAENMNDNNDIEIKENEKMLESNDIEEDNENKDIDEEKIASEENVKYAEEKQNLIKEEEGEESKENFKDEELVNEKEPNFEINRDIYDWLIDTMERSEGPVREPELEWRKKRSIKATSAEDMTNAETQPRSKRSLYDDYPYDDVVPMVDENDRYLAEMETLSEIEREIEEERQPKYEKVERLLPEMEEGENEDLYYEVIEHQGVPGLFIPLENRSKKPYPMSLIPGMKRAAPYGLYDTLAEKRNQAEAYDRLYRLAAELQDEYKR